MYSVIPVTVNVILIWIYALTVGHVWAGTTVSDKVYWLLVFGNRTLEQSLRWGKMRQYGFLVFFLYHTMSEKLKITLKCCLLLSGWHWFTKKKNLFASLLLLTVERKENRGEEDVFNSCSLPSVVALYFFHSFEICTWLLRIRQHFLSSLIEAGPPDWVVAHGLSTERSNGN